MGAKCSRAISQPVAAEAVSCFYIPSKIGFQPGFEPEKTQFCSRRGCITIQQSQQLDDTVDLPDNGRHARAAKTLCMDLRKKSCSSVHGPSYGTSSYPLFTSCFQHMIKHFYTSLLLHALFHHATSYIHARGLGVSGNTFPLTHQVLLPLPVLLTGQQPLVLQTLRVKGAVCRLLCAAEQGHFLRTHRSMHTPHTNKRTSAS